MKRTLICTLVVFAALLGAGNRVANKTAAAYTLQYSLTTDAGTLIKVGDAATKQYVGNFFTNPNAVTLTKGAVYIKRNGTVSFNIRLSIYSHSAGRPATLLSSSGWTAASGLSTSLAWVEFSGLSASVSASTTYWVVLQTDAAGDGNNYVGWERESTQSYPGWSISQSSTDGTTWVNEENTGKMLKVYSGP